MKQRNKEQRNGSGLNDHQKQKIENRKSATNLMRKKLLTDISASTIQVMLNQVLGLFIFIIISRYLDKVVYGEMNWSLAVLGFITGLLSLRLEQVVVRKVAAGDDASKMLTIFAVHCFFSGLVFYLLLLSGCWLFPGFFAEHNLLLILAISHLLSFFASPYKQLAAGAGRFGWLAVISSVANMARVVMLVMVVLFSALDIRQVMVIYILSSLLELLAGIYLVRTRLDTGISFRYGWGDYVVLLKESIPQIGVVFLHACIARIDWILLGIFSTQVITAEYSFAYKVFELSPVPMLIIAPVLLTRFSSYFKTHAEQSLWEHRQKLGLLIRAEMVIASFLPLLLNVAWAPLMDMLTAGKYGAVNTTTFLLLSLCIPFQYLINLLWTIHFSLNHLVLILRITAVTCTIIVAGDLLMIPLLHAKGAALVYLSAIFVEYLLYLWHSSFLNRRDTWLPLAVCMTIAGTSGVAVHYMAVPVITKILLAALIYAFLVLATGQLRRKDIALLKQWLPKKNGN